MDAKQAIDLLKYKSIGGTERFEIADLIESLEAKAELGEAAEKEFAETAKEWACEGKYQSSNCIVNDDDYHCKCRDFCRLRAGMVK